MNVKTLVYLVVLMLVINIAAIGTIIYERVTRPEFAFPPMGMGGPENAPEASPDSWRPGRDFGLRPEQMQRLRQSGDSLRTILAPETEKLEEFRRQLFDEFGKDEPDRELIHRLVEEMGRIQTGIHLQVVDNILRDGALLDPEQRAFLLRMLEQRSFRQQRGPNPDHWRRSGRRGN